uniref:Uncharacterized protein n=1 Tax=Populus trichocarpa TaxID=3694 RepID=A0A2K1WPU8_POPTR
MVAAVVGGATVVPGGDAAVCFLLPRAEAQASVSLGAGSFFFKGVAAGKEDGGRLPAVADQWSCYGGRR